MIQYFPPLPLPPPLPLCFFQGAPFPEALSDLALGLLRLCGHSDTGCFLLLHWLHLWKNRESFGHTMPPPPLQFPALYCLHGRISL